MQASLFAFISAQVRAVAMMHGDKSLQQFEKTVRMFRPTLLPDNKSLVWYPLAILGFITAHGFLFGSVPLAIASLCVIAVFRGLPVAIHSLYFLSVKITVCGNTLIVFDWVGAPFIAYPRRAGTIAKTKNGLVLSDRNGDNKIYITHFHDLSREDW